MSMHLLPPMYSTTGKKKGKQKHRNSASAAKARDNAESWQQLMEKWDVKTKTTPVRKSANLATNLPNLNARLSERSTRHIASVDTGAGIAVKKQPLQYTGTECIGIAVMHKSCLQPVFNSESAKDIAKMRR